MITILVITAVIEGLLYISLRHARVIAEMRAMPEAYGLEIN